MKKILTFLLLFVSFLSFSQEKRIIKSGYITFNSGSILEFKDLTIDDQKASYFNEISQTEMIFSLQSVKNIIDGSGIKIYETAKDFATKKENGGKTELDDITVTEEIKKEELVYKSISRIYRNGEKLRGDNLELLLQSNANVYNKYKKGKSEARLGDILMGGGIGLFIGGGISNLNSANSGKEGGSPAILIIGLATSIVGIPVKIGGVKKVKEAVQDYNSLSGNHSTFFDKTELKVLAGPNGIGFALRF